MSTTQNNTNIDITEEEKQLNLSLDVTDSDRVMNTSTGLDPSLSLDNEDEKEEIVYVRHVNDNKIFSIPYSAAVHSGLIKIIIDEKKETNGKTEDDPFIIPNTVKSDAFYFSINYMLFNKENKYEKPAPEPPLKESLNLETILGDEYKLFEQFDKLKINQKKDKIAINDYFEMASYMDFKQLDNKLAAITAYNIRELSEKLTHFIDKIDFECDNKERIPAVVACQVSSGEFVTADSINIALNASINKVTPYLAAAFIAILEGADMSIFLKADAGAAETAEVDAPEPEH